MNCRKPPIEWSTVNLGSLINLSTGKLDANAADINGQYPFFTCAESISQINTWAFDTSAVILAGNGSFSIKRYTGKFNAYQRTYIIEPVFIKIDFLYWVIRGNIISITMNGRGSTIPYIRKGDITDIQISLPPLAEQKIIADKLDDLLARVESIKTRLENIPEILKKFRQSVLSAAVSGKLTEELRNSDSFGENLFLGDLIFSGPQNGLYKPTSFYGRGTKIIRIDSFYDGEIIDWEKIKKVELSKDELDKWALRKNDVLINRVNSIEYLGKCALVKSIPSECVFESNIMRMSLIEEKVIPEYIILYLCSQKGIFELRKNAKLAVNQASINQNDVKNCIILLPNINEQKEIIRRVNIYFSYADKVSENVFRALSKVNIIDQAILAKAFRGELTAQWREENPELISGINSAEALLEKITAEKLAAGTVKKRAKKSPH